MDFTSMNKKGFILISTLLLISVLFGYVYAIKQTDIFQSNLNTLKYMNHQAQIQLDAVKNYIIQTQNPQIENYILDDDRFDLEILFTNEDGDTKYYITIEPKQDNIPIRLSEIIIK
jgi:hypothetical protein